jgi:hypothetical protein
MLFKAILINLLLLAGYCTLLVTGVNAGDRGFNIAITGGLCMVIQVGVNMITGLVMMLMGKKMIGKSLLIVGGILVPVSFCTWLILLSIYG